MSDFVILIEEDLDVDNLPFPAILEVVVLPGDIGDGLLVDVGDVMVPCPILLVGVCLLVLIKSRRQLTLTTWSRKNQGPYFLNSRILMIDNRLGCVDMFWCNTLVLQLCSPTLSSFRFSCF